MKHIIPTILLQVIAIGISLGQQSIYSDPQTFVKHGEPNDTDIEYYIHITNTSTHIVQLLWSKRLNDAPGAWWSWICDINQCYLPETTTCPDDLPNLILPGDTVEFSMHINPRNVVGTGFLTMTLLDLNGNAVDTIVGEYIVGTTATQGPDTAGQPIVVPNPAADYFQLRHMNSDDEVAVYELTGKLIRSFNRTDTNSYFVGDLQPGLYLVGVTDQHGTPRSLQRIIIQ